MKLVRIAIDCNMPERFVALFPTGFKDQGFEFIYETKFASHRDEDEHWAKLFKKFGGHVVISADRNIAKRPHQRLAFKKAGLKCFFLPSRWHDLSLSYRAGHVLSWWPRMAAQLKMMKRGEAYWVPATMTGAFKKVAVPEEVLDAAGQVAKR